jgi:hypothetical protein
MTTQLSTAAALLIALCAAPATAHAEGADSASRLHWSAALGQGHLVSGSSHADALFLRSLGPSLAALTGALRLDATAGFFWCVGGIGPVGSVAGGYAIALSDRIAIDLAVRASVLPHLGGDAMRTAGWDIAPTAMVGLRSR